MGQKRYGARSGAVALKKTKEEAMEISELDQELESNHLAGFWSTRTPLHSPEAPFLWKWAGVLDGLTKAKDSVGLDMAERRVR